MPSIIYTQVGYPIKLILAYDDDSVGYETNDDTVKEMSCVHYTGDGQDYDCRSDDDHDVLEFEIDMLVEEQPLVEYN